MQLKRWHKIILFLFAIVLVFLIVFMEKISRLQIVLSLFEPENITENFYNMENIFPAYVINPSTTPTKFIENNSFTLPETFQYNDSTLNTKEYLEYTQTTGLLILHGDSILIENYYKGYSKDKDHISWSLSKSFVSGMVGIALEKGMIKSINEPVEKYAPILKGSGYEGVSIKDVLQMSSGIAFNEDYHDFFSDINKLGRVFALGLSFDKYVASMKRSREPGTYHNYVSMDTQVLGMVLKGATNMNISKFMEEFIWKPIGAEDKAYWLKDNKGIEGAFGGLNCSLRDYGRYGKLFADLGYANGKQIIDTSWIMDSTTPTEAHLLPGADSTLTGHPYGYGYQWWIPGGIEGEFTGMGIYNQYIYVDRINKIVIVKNSSNYHYATQKRKTTFRHMAFLRAIREDIIKSK